MELARSSVHVPFAHPEKQRHTKEYAAGGVTPLRQSYTDYNLAQGYLDRRIIGLVSSSKVYVNDRRTNWGYDAAGNLTNDLRRQYVYDAAGRMKSFNSGMQSYGYDGDGEVASVARQVEGATTTLYNLRSTALGGEVVSQLTPQTNAPDVREDIIQVGGGAVVRHSVWPTLEQVSWEHEDAASTTVQEKGVGTFGAFTSPTVQLDPVGVSVGNADPSQFEEPPAPPDETSPEMPVFGNPIRGEWAAPATSCRCFARSWP